MKRINIINKRAFDNPYPSRVKRFAGRFLWVALVMAAGLCLGWAETWDSIRDAATGVNSISADFVQEKHLPILAAPLVSNGRLWYRRPDSLRWEYISPVKNILLLHDGTARRFVQSDQGLVEDASVHMQAMQFVMPEISGWLGGRFEDNPLFDASLDGAKKIQMVPKDAGMARFIQRIELLMSDRPGVIEEVVIFESEEAFTRMVFSNTQVNPVIDDRLFQEAQ
ncbi:outer membrane lipoprotein carrier protein LolA [uncultured Desulfosarcina sp.]|uniref:outer membrane lipoprotein carrier protein LolA n=1 Tax=uncultured Desulfosarcina sp. TaxID=218289 RepID=UPI0029C82DF9|nr:outer membrane lipoprotein carrier protein LolA [uncultured Desulfosarcina sp.]